MRKVFVSKEAFVGRKGRWMSGFKNMVLGAVDDGALFLCVAAPEQEHEMFFLVGEGFDSGVCEGFPALVLVRPCLVSFYGESCIEKKNTLLREIGEVTCFWHVASNVANDFFVDIQKRWRNINAVLNGKGEAVGLAWAMVRVLPKNDDANFVEGRLCEGFKNLCRRWVDFASLIGAANKIGNFFEVGFGEFILQNRLPALF